MKGLPRCFVAPRRGRFREQNAVAALAKPNQKPVIVHIAHADENVDRMPPIYDAAIVVSSLYYSPLALATSGKGSRQARQAGQPPSPGKIAAELARTLLIAFARGDLLTRLEALGSISRAAAFATYPGCVLGSCMGRGHDVGRHPWQVAACHSGDRLLKTMLVALILSVWPTR